MIENMGVTRDQFDTIDMSDNEIYKLGNFPVLRRLRTLLLNNNHIRSVDAKIGKQLVELRHLVLTNNRLSNLGDIDNIASLPELIELSLVDNPVVRRPNYRLYTIHKIPSLRLLDFRKIRRKERERAKKLFSSEAGKDLESQVQRAKASGSSEEKKGPTRAQLEAFRKAIREAKTAREVDYLERMARVGRFPPFEQDKKTMPPSNTNQKSDDVSPTTTSTSEKSENVPSTTTTKTTRQQETRTRSGSDASSKGSTPPKKKTRGRTRSNSKSKDEKDAMDVVDAKTTTTRRRTRSRSGSKESSSKTSPRETKKASTATRRRTRSTSKDDNEKTTSDGSYTKAELTKLRVVDLKKILKKAKMGVKGRKADLIARLVGVKKV